MNIDIIWQRIVQHQGEEFRTVRRLLLTYTVDGDCILTNRTDCPIYKSQFEIALEAMPASKPSDLPESVWGPSYVFAILTDERICKK